MLPIVAAMLAGAALGAVKGKGDQDAAKRQRKQEAETARWSPWTGMRPNPVKEGDMFGSMLQGSMGGASMAGMFGGGGAAAGAGGAAAGAGAGGGGAALVGDPSGAANMSADPALQQQGLTNQSTYNAQMQQKYPWLGMQS